MRVSFEKESGAPASDIAFFWQLEIAAGAPHSSVTETFIPELFYDFLYVARGNLGALDPVSGAAVPQPRQLLKTIQTGGRVFVFEAPITLYGARFHLRFAETWWGSRLAADSLIQLDWIAARPADLAEFSAQVRAHVSEHRQQKNTVPLLTPDLEETSRLAHFSARHKRRLYQSTYGVSRKGLLAIRGLHAFLQQTCDFSAQRPRIIDYIDSEHYYDQPHLNRSFKKMTGRSPLEYFETPAILQDNLLAATYNETRA